LPKLKKKTTNYRKYKMKEKRNKLDELKPFVVQLIELQEKAIIIYKPKVENLIQNKVTDDNTIQQLLDGMLDFCSHTNMLFLYKKLCRYYWEINSEANANYINYYRKMWDNDKPIDNEN